MTPLILGIDVGTTNAKALIATPDGVVMAHATAPIPLLTPRPGYVEQEPEAWWQAVVQATRAALGALPTPSPPIAAIGVSGQGCAATLLDKARAPLRPGIIWMDARAEAECAHLRRWAERIFELNGKQPGPYNFDPKLIWLQRHEPEILAQAHVCLTTTGYVNYRLTGQQVLNVSDASIPLAFDQASGDWSEELIDSFGIPRHLYPRVAPCREIIGGLTPNAAEALGLPPGIPVIAGGEDTSAAGLSVGVVRPGQAMLSLGTGGSVYVVQDRPVAHPQLLTFAHVLEHQRIVGGTILAFGASLAWCKELLDVANFEAVNTLAAESVPGAEKLLFLPYLSGELQPINEGHVRGVFFGLSLNTRRPQFVRAVMEGTAFAIAHNLQLAIDAGAKPDELRAVGGPTKSAIWCQIIADITGLPVMVLKNEAGAPLGDIFLAAAAVGLIPSAGAAAERAAEIAHVVTPDPRHAQFYSELFAVYRQMYPALKAQFAALAQVVLL